MAQCGYCATTILFGGVREGEKRFCNNTCYQNYCLMQLAAQVPPDVVQRELMAVHQGLCPRCGGSGPVDVHKIYKVWSAFVLTSWQTNLQVSCRSCGLRGQALGMAFCLCLGWWGIPWGLVMTPVQVVRNLVAMCSGIDPLRPSPELENFVRVTLAAQWAQNQPQVHAPPVIR